MGKTRENNNAVESDDRFEALKLKNQICFPLYACAKEIVRRYKPYLDKIDLTYTQYVTMMVLWTDERISAHDLGKKLYLDSGTLTPLLKALEQKGYVVRTRSKEDERVLMIELTESGRALKAQAGSVPEHVGACIPLGAQDAADLYRILYTLLKAMES